jgi:hypothetical protein
MMLRAELVVARPVWNGRWLVVTDGGVGSEGG